MTNICRFYENAGLSGKLTLHFGALQFKKRDGPKCHVVSVSDTSTAVVFKVLVETRNGTWLVAAFASLQGTTAVAAFAAIQAIKADKPEESAPTPVLTATATAAAPRPAPPEVVAAPEMPSKDVAETDEESAKSPFNGFVRDETRRGLLLDELVKGPRRMKGRDNVNVAVRAALLRVRGIAGIPESVEPSVKSLGQIVGNLLVKGYVRESASNCRSDWKSRGEPYMLDDLCWTEIDLPLPGESKKEASLQPVRSVPKPPEPAKTSPKIIRMVPPQPRVSPPSLPAANSAELLQRATLALGELQKIEAEVGFHLASIDETRGKIESLEARAEIIRQDPVVAAILAQMSSASAQEKRA